MQSDMLVSGGLELALAPAAGGSVAAFRMRVDGRPVDLMRPMSAEAQARHDPIGAAMFPMVPFANRIGRNRLTFRGRGFDFPANNPPERYHVHGTGWHSAWTETRLGLDAAILSLDRAIAGEPYAYRAEQRFALTPEALVLTMAVENRGPETMPFGFGAHPWFIRDPDVELRFSAEKFWLEGPDHVATDPVSIPPELSFHDWSALPRGWRNNCYSGWHGVAEIRWPSRGVGLEIVADPLYGHLMLYCSPDAPFFCLEPQTHATSAFDHMVAGREAELGVIVLAPGERAEGAMTFSPFRLD